MSSGRKLCAANRYPGMGLESNSLAHQTEVVDQSPA